jgi:hypothetical protein
MHGGGKSLKNNIFYFDICKKKNFSSKIMPTLLNNFSQSVIFLFGLLVTPKKKRNLKNLNIVYLFIMGAIETMLM